VSELVFQILDAARDRDVVPFGSAFPSPTLFPWPKLARSLGSAARHMDPWSTVESLPPGSVELRRQIARRYLKFGTNVSAEEIDTITLPAGTHELTIKPVSIDKGELMKLLELQLKSK